MKAILNIFSHTLRLPSTTSEVKNNLKQKLIIEIERDGATVCSLLMFFVEMLQTYKSLCEEFSWEVDQSLVEVCQPDRSSN